MKTAALLTILFSFQGYWFGGQDAHLQITPAVQMPAGHAKLEWKLAAAGVAVGGGEVPFEVDGKTADVVIHTPTVSRRADLKFTYTVMLAGDAKPVLNGETPIHLFPTGLISDHSQAGAEKTIVVIETGDGISKMLQQAKLKSASFKNASRLPLLSPDVVLVGPGAYSKAVDESLGEQIRHGTSAFVMAQPAGESVLGYPYAAQRAPAKFRWEASHPLFGGLGLADLEKLAHADSARPVCVQLPADAPVLVLSAWPHEQRADSDKTAPISALITTQTMGRGRLVLCQIASLDWEHDPRAAILLNNTLDYLLTRPEPTPRPSEKNNAPALKRPATPDNRIPLGE